MESSVIRLLLVLLFVNLGYGDTPGHPTPGTGERLLMIQALTRHGDRAAQEDSYITPIAPLIFFRGRGELTNEGIDNARATGVAYRGAYVDDVNFIDGRFKPSQVKFRSSEVDRVMMTAGSFSGGLFNWRELLLQSGPVNVPVAYTPYEQDDLLAPQFDCINGWDDIIEMYGLNSTYDVADQLLDSMRHREWNCTVPPAFQSDTIIAETANKITNRFLNSSQRDCGQGDAKRFMYKYIESLGGSGSNANNSLVRLQRTIGKLANEIVDNFKDMVYCSSNPPPIPTCCPAEGVWSEWTTTGPCSTTCGSCNNATRVRTCISMNDGCPCTGPATDTGPCGTAVCPFPTKTCCVYFVKTLNGNTNNFFCGDGVATPKNPTYNCTAVPDCSKMKKAHFLFAHDVNLIALMNTFSMQKGSMDFFQGITPAFASSLSMELWKSSDKHYVKMWIKNGVNELFREFNFCNFLPTEDGFTKFGRYCTLDALEKAKNMYINTDEAVCIPPPSPPN